jgi:hypothetical protein
MKARGCVVHESDAEDQFHKSLNGSFEFARRRRIDLGSSATAGTLAQDVIGIVIVGI